MQKIVFQGTADVKRKLLWGGCLALALSVTCAWQVLAMSEGKSDFPDGGDAVQAAPESHKIIFENAVVRVLEVPIPPVGKPEPMHHHRWPSLMLHWDTGGKSPHIRYHRSDGYSEQRYANTSRAMDCHLDESRANALGRNTGLRGRAGTTVHSR